MRQSQEGRALRQFTLSTGKSAGRNSSGRITVFHRGGESKRLQRRIDLKRSTSSMGIVERIESSIGARLTEVPKQPQYALLPIEKQILVIYAAVNGFCDRMLYRLFALILKPIIRILISYLYFIILRKLFNWSEGESLYTIHSICLAVTHSLPSTTHSLPLPPEEDSFGINVLLESSSNASQNSLELFRTENAAIETELFSRIRAVESHLAHGLPPQLNPGEYEGLVREHLEGAVTIRTYQTSLALELFDVQIMEKKVFLQDKLFDLFLADPRLFEILAISPFQERDIRPAIFDFIEGKVEPVSAARDSFQRNLLEASLLNFIRELERSGRQSFIYREFYAYFSDEEFRQGLRDP